MLLHGGLFDIDQQFGALLPSLSGNRQVVGLDFQGHGRTNDIERPLSAASLASDVIALLDHLGLDRVDVFGNSRRGSGGPPSRHQASRPRAQAGRRLDDVRRFGDARRQRRGRGGDRPIFDMIAGTPMEQSYLAKSPHPDREHLQGLLDKLGATYESGFEGWSEDDIRGIAAPTLITVGDCDMVSLDHAVRFLRLRGGDVNGDFDGVPGVSARGIPGTTHFFGLARTNLVSDVVVTFLDSPAAEG